MKISDYSHNFLLSLQCYSFFPVIDKPTRVNSATLIDNIFVNRFDHKISSGNIVSDTSDHYAQFCFIHSLTLKNLTTKYKIRDYSNFSEECFINDVWDSSMANGSVDKCFSSFYNKLNKLINKHAPFKTLSKRKAKQFSKPWITKGLRKSIKIKNRLLLRRYIKIQAVQE